MQDDLDDAMDWAVGAGFIDPARTCIMGASHGGYAELCRAIRNPGRYRCAISFAGVTDFVAQLRYDRDYLGRRAFWEGWRDQVRGEDKSFDLDDVSPAKQVERLTRPVLLVHGKKDRRGPIEQFETMVKATQRADRPLEALELDDGHNLSEEKNEKLFLESVVAFLAKQNPAS